MKPAERLRQAFHGEAHIFLFYEVREKRNFSVLLNNTRRRFPMVGVLE